MGARNSLRVRCCRERILLFGRRFMDVMGIHAEAGAMLPLPRASGRPGDNVDQSILHEDDFYYPVRRNHFGNLRLF